MENTTTAKEIIARFVQVGEDYSVKVTAHAHRAVEALLSDDCTNDEDFEEALWGLPSPLYAFRGALSDARKALAALPDEDCGGGYKSIDNAKLTVRRRIENSYADAFRIIEDGAIDYIIAQYGFFADILKIPEHKRKALFRETWDTVRRISGAPRIPALMHRFVDALGVVDTALCLDCK